MTRLLPLYSGSLLLVYIYRLNITFVCVCVSQPLFQCEVLRSSLLNVTTLTCMEFDELAAGIWSHVDVCMFLYVSIGFHCFIFQEITVTVQVWLGKTW